MQAAGLIAVLSVAFAFPCTHRDYRVVCRCKDRLMLSVDL